MTRMFFVSNRTGRSEIWCEIRATGELQQLTNQPELHEWSVHPSHGGRFVYFTAGKGACRISTDNLAVELLINFRSLASQEVGMVGAAMGTTTLSFDDHYWAVPVKIGAGYRFCIIDTRTGQHEVILEGETLAIRNSIPPTTICCVTLVRTTAVSG